MGETWVFVFFPLLMVCLPTKKAINNEKTKQNKTKQKNKKKKIKQGNKTH